MAPSVEAVRDLAELIAEKALPAALSELDEITEFAHKSGKSDIEKLMPWDIPYCESYYVKFKVMFLFITKSMWYE